MEPRVRRIERGVQREHVLVPAQKPAARVATGLRAFCLLDPALQKVPTVRSHRKEAQLRLPEPQHHSSRRR